MCTSRGKEQIDQNFLFIYHVFKICLHLYHRMLTLAKNDSYMNMVRVWVFMFVYLLSRKPWLTCVSSLLWNEYMFGRLVP